MTDHADIPLASSSSSSSSTPPDPDPASAADATWGVRLLDGTEYRASSREELLGWARAGRVPTSATLVVRTPGGASRTTPVLEDAEIARIVAAPPTVRGEMSSPRGGFSMIPSKNKPALIGYYLGFVAALLFLAPAVGPILGGVTILLGIKGIRRYQADNTVRGMTHSIVAILLGLFAVAAGGLVSALMIAAMLDL